LTAIQGDEPHLTAIQGYETHLNWQGCTYLMISAHYSMYKRGQKHDKCTPSTVSDEWRDCTARVLIIQVFR